MPVRFAYLFGLIIIILLLAASFYLQFVKGIMPCPLCTLQRMTFVLLGIFFAIGIFVHRILWLRIILNTLIFLATITGIGLSGRQVWIQHYPPPLGNECGVSLQYILQVLPVHEAFEKILTGSAECAEKASEFLHLTIAEWTMVWFLLFFLLSIYLFLKEFKWTGH